MCVCAGVRIRDRQFFFLRTLKLVFHCCGRRKNSPLQIRQTEVSIKAAKSKQLCLELFGRQTHVKRCCREEREPGPHKGKETPRLLTAPAGMALGSGARQEALALKRPRQVAVSA